MNATALIGAIGTGEAFQHDRSPLGLAWYHRRLQPVDDHGSLGSAREEANICANADPRRTISVADLDRQSDPLGEWFPKLVARTHKNAAVVALGNKLARIALAAFNARVLAGTV